MSKHAVQQPQHRSAGGSPDPTEDTLPAPAGHHTPEQAVVPGQIVSRYRILRCLGSGGIGEVFEAEDLRLGRRVALKFLKPWIASDEALRARLKREARAASALDHPSICSIHDIDETESGLLFIVMALYRGETLERQIARGPLPVDAALDVAVQVGRGLAAADAAGIVHRDVKPANVMITDGGEVKILDFGIAQLRGRDRLTEPGGIVGTLAYMSPEQAVGDNTDRRTDVWSLGVMLYEMLTGEKPFRGAGPAVTGSILNEKPQPPSDLRPGVGEALERIVTRALAKVPGERYQCMDDLLRDLGALGGPDDAIDVLPFPSIRCRDRPEEARTEFVDRERELEQLDRRLDEALAGRGRVAFVTGEAGSGKTALMTHFARLAQLAEARLVVAGGSCNAHTSIGDPYLPFREVLALLTGDVEARWAAGAMDREQAGRLWKLLPASARALCAAGRGLVETFLPGPALLERAEARATGTPDWLARLAEVVARRTSRDVGRLTQSDLFEQYGKVLRALARSQPLLLLLDDLQWADAGSISLLFHLGRRLAGNRVLILGAYRPTEVALGRDGDRHPLTPVLHELQRDLGDSGVDLERTEGRHFVEAFLDSEPNRLNAGFRETFWRQTGGHALHSVELLRAMQDSGALATDAEGRWVEGPSLDWAAIPARVEAVVGERIARLEEEDAELLTLASVEGEEFTAEAVARAMGLDDLEAVRRLSGALDRSHRLVVPTGVRRLGEQRLSLFRFRHNLFQKYLYGRLTPPERAYLHEQLATVLETLYGERSAEISVQLARHFELAGMARQAAGYLQQAGDGAARRSANAEAIAHFTRGLELVATLDAGGERDALELELLVSLGPVLMAAEGWAAEATERTYSRALELCRRSGASSRLFPVLWGSWQFHNVVAELGRARQEGDELLALARGEEDPTLLPAAHRALGETSFWLGDLAAADDWCDRGRRLYDLEKHRSHGFVFGLDSGVICEGFRSWSLWCLGSPDQALERARGGEALARRVGHPFSLGLARYYLCVCHQWRGEVPAARQWSAATMELAAAEEFLMLRDMGRLVHGWAEVEEGETEAGIAGMRGAVERWQPDLARPFFSGMLAESLLTAGDAAAALAAVDEGLAARGEDRVWRAELHRLRGEALAAAGAPAREIEPCYRRALEVARSQGARSLELRAATSLRRLARGGPGGEEATGILARVYRAFGEGLGTRDLAAARELLEG